MRFVGRESNCERRDAHSVFATPAMGARTLDEMWRLQYGQTIRGTGLISSEHEKAILFSRPSMPSWRCHELPSEFAVPIEDFLEALLACRDRQIDHEVLDAGPGVHAFFMPPGDPGTAGEQCYPSGNVE